MRALRIHRISSRVENIAQLRGLLLLSQHPHAPIRAFYPESPADFDHFQTALAHNHRPQCVDVHRDLAQVWRRD
jgi:hypothetical protein